MTFTKWELDEMREWLKNLPASNPKVRYARLICFDLMRYREAYDEIYNYMEVMGATVI